MGEALTSVIIGEPLARAKSSVKRPVGALTFLVMPLPLLLVGEVLSPPETLVTRPYLGDSLGRVKDTSVADSAPRAFGSLELETSPLLLVLMRREEDLDGILRDGEGRGEESDLASLPFRALGDGGPCMALRHSNSASERG